MAGNYYFNEEHNIFRQALRSFLDKEIVPKIDEWEKKGFVPKEIFKKFGSMGYFGLGFEDKYGGFETDIMYKVILVEELNKCNSGGAAASLLAHSTLSMEHIQQEGSELLKQKYLVPAIKGEKVGCLAITEPHTGSDVASISCKAIKKEDHYLINGSKTFITNGVFSDFLVVALRTGEKGLNGISLVVIDRDMKGIQANSLNKLGWHASDTGEIAFDNVKVPLENLIGKENKGFYYIMQRFEIERLTISLGAIASAEFALSYAIQYMSERKAFGRTINKFQVLRHRLAQLSSETECLKTFNYQICKDYENGDNVMKECAMSKLLCTELSDKISYQTIQFLGGYGYMEEYKAARMFRDSRLGTIGGGTSEIMREIIAKTIIN